jgi:hypothetical protein
LLDSKAISSYDLAELEGLFQSKEKLRERASSVAILLRGLGTWGISQRLASTIEGIIEE